MERGLVLRQHFFGSDSEEVWSACKIVGEMCNLLAMTYLQQEDFAMVLELLKKAEILTERDEAGRAVTYNNLACYYRRRGKLHAALQYLHKALKIEAKMVCYVLESSPVIERVPLANYVHLFCRHGVKGSKRTRMKQKLSCALLKYGVTPVGAAVQGTRR